MAALNPFRVIHLLVGVFIAQLGISQSWHEVQKIFPNDRQVGDRFGYRGGDIEGNIAVLAGYLNGTDSMGNNFIYRSGAIYVFSPDSSGEWKEQQKIVHADRYSEDILGLNVAIQNGMIAAQSWNSYDTNGLNYKYRAGAIYLFKKNPSGKFKQFQKIITSDRNTEDYLGEGIEHVRFSGTDLFVACREQDYDTVNSVHMSASGAIYKFSTNAQGKYLEKEKITASDRDTADYFGSSFDVSGDILVVGATGEDHDENGNNFIFNAGSAYIFVKNSSGKFQQTQKLTANFRNQFAGFGQYVKIIDSTIIVSATSDPTDSINANFVQGAGAIYVFKPNQLGVWELHQKISNSDRNLNNSFGSPVFFADSTMFVGCVSCDKDSNGNSINDAGSSVLFQLNKDGYYYEETTITPSSRQAQDAFCTGDIDQNYIVFGTGFHSYAQGTTAYKKEAGAAFLFTRCADIIYPDTFNICIGDSIELGGVFRSEPGIYVDSFKTIQYGCDSLRYHVLETDTLNVSIYSANGIIYSNIQNAAYQWIDCITGLDIANETSYLFTPVNSGSYAVRVTKGACTKTTDCHEVDYVGVRDIESHFTKIYPNPSDGTITIEFPIDLRYNRMLLINSTGQLVRTWSFENQNRVELVTTIPSGIYSLIVTHDEGTERFSVIIE